ncbi:hypothetical protein ZIOFF_054355 [Zingiber officinale]|uniref:Peptidyl-prolyl cis-trans isomerase n=1 Tax=Zingiber officinale TaxID=94328 RepID=A0A8J5FEV5_ZINOF|nr:hypothetical protein ZIOFF_054355 [Zingiber officinale]
MGKKLPPTMGESLETYGAAPSQMGKKLPPTMGESFFLLPHQQWELRRSGCPKNCQNPFFLDAHPFSKKPHNNRKTKHFMAKIKPQALLLQSKKKKAPSRISKPFFILFSCMHELSNGIGTGMEDIEHLETFGESTRSGLPNYAILITGKGPITIELDKDSSRDVVDKFVNLCQKGYFKGMLFNHVIKNYIIQGGHSQKAGAAVEWILKGKSQHQLATSGKHETFVLGTGKPTKDNKEFELFITTAAISDLNDKLIIFGRVIKGEEVVQEIEKVDTDQRYQPKSPVGITNVILKQEA